MPDGEKEKEMDPDGGMLAVALVATFLVLLVVYQYVSYRSHPPLPPGGLLLSLPTTRDGIRGIENEYRTPCPQDARSRLAALSNGHRGILFLYGQTWTVCSGTALAVRTGGAPRLTVYHLRHSAPAIQASGETDNAGQGATRAATPPPPLPGWTAQPNSVVSALAEPENVRRFDTAEAATAHLASQPGNAQFVDLVVYNGPNDPTFYTLRVRSSRASTAVTYLPNHPAVVYVRAS
jgi:hypothetical protein